jgi:peptidyl-prolyl cis-trans isomerase C
MEKSKDPMSARGGDYGYMPANALLPPFADGIKGLKKGDFSEEPFKSNFGFSVFKLDDQRKSSPPPLEELKGQIAAQLRHEIADDVRRQVEAKAKIERFNADGTPIIMAAPPAPPQQPAPSPPVPAPQAQPPVPPANIAPPAKK